MPRWLAALLVVVLLPWQSLVWAVDATRANPAHGGESHVVAHWMEEAHHHHHDGSFHDDDSDESFRHLHADSHLNTLSVPPGVLTWMASALPSGAPPPLPSPSHPEPFLEGLRRPPRVLA